MCPRKKCRPYRKLDFSSASGVKISQNRTFIFKKIKINLLANMPGAR